MRELNRTRRLIIASTIFIAIIIIGLLTFRKPDFEYSLTPEAMTEELISHQDEMTPAEAHRILDANDDSFVFIDLRSPYEFDRGSIPNAVNIPVSDILDKEAIDFFRQTEDDAVTLVFFSGDQRAANGPWMLLKQIGFDHIKVLMGGYDFVGINNEIQPDSKDLKGYDAEEPALDFAAFMKEAGGNSPDENSQGPIPIQPVKRKKKSAAEGGC